MKVSAAKNQDAIDGREETISAPAFSRKLRLKVPIQSRNGIVHELELRAPTHETAMNILRRHRSPVEALIRLLARGARITDDEAGSLAQTDFVAALDILFELFEHSENQLLRDLLAMAASVGSPAH